jgi:PAS domain S-box-containing protein
LIIDDNPAIHDDFKKIFGTISSAGSDAGKSELDRLESGLFGEPVHAKPVLEVDLDSAYQGQDGMRLVTQSLHDQRPYAVIFVDMRMPPGWDGLETTMRILEHDPFAQVVICTAYSDYSWAEMTNRLGASDRVLILKKPFDNVEVIQLVQSLSRKWDLLQESLANRLRLEHLVQERTNELASTNARLTSLIQSCPLGILASDERGVVTTWNPAAQRMFGWSLVELAARAEEGQPEEDLRPQLRTMISGLLAGQTGSGSERRAACKDGTFIDVSFATAITHDVRGRIDGLMSIVTDVTMQKRIESELRRAKEAAEAATQAKSDFLANMSHEIRTPMNGVIGMTDLLMDTALNEEQLEYANTVRACGETLLTLINDILDYSKIEAGKLDLESISFSPRVMIEETVAMIAERAHAKSLDLCTLISADMPNRVMGDPSRLRQILLNLLSNAIKFTEKGDVSVSAQVVHGDNELEILHLAVRDSGIGLSSETKARLFQQFTQADSSVTRKYGGTGLGLAISKRLIELMGGTITVQSTLGQGSEFTCIVPLRGSKEETVEALPIDLTGRKALCIDGSAISRRALKEQLQSWGMACDEAHDESSAVAALRAASGLPDLIIIDSHLPGMEGIALARVLTAHLKPHLRPIILLAAIAHRGMASVASEAGIAGFLTKPIRQAQLYDCMVAVLNLGTKKVPTTLVTRHSIAEAKAARRRRVLVAEDNKINQRVITMQLTKLDCQVDVVGSGAEALAAISCRSYDLVFMDCSMPEMDGYTATRHIRSQEEPGHRIPIIALTASVMQGDRQRCIDAGMDEFVAKPASIEALIHVLNLCARDAGTGSSGPVKTAIKVTP